MPLMTDKNFRREREIYGGEGERKRKQEEK